MTRFYIYSIQHNSDASYGRYVGSTRNMTNRMNLHKNYACKHHGVLYQMIRNSGGWQNWNVKCLEEVETEDKELRYAREQFWIDNTPEKINQRNAVGNPKADLKRYYVRNRDSILESKKEYYQMNKEILKNKQKERTKRLREELVANLAKANMKPPRKSKYDTPQQPEQHVVHLEPESEEEQDEEIIYENNIKAYYAEDDNEIDEVSSCEQEI